MKICYKSDRLKMGEISEIISSGGIQEELIRYKMFYCIFPLPRIHLV